jgi:hypothetical protein
MGLRQSFQSKVLGAPWYVTNLNFDKDLNLPAVHEKLKIDFANSSLTRNACPTTFLESSKSPKKYWTSWNSQ